ncbi:MAG: 2-oxo acid dehydrogenase subunit E2 [Flavobacteriaceae bacterium]
MAEIINMPRLSDTMEEGTVAKWFKKVGDAVKEGDILAEIETDKATMEFEAFHEGHLLHIGIEEGGTAPVDTLLAIIGEKGENIGDMLQSASTTSATTQEASTSPAEETSSTSAEMPEGVVVITMPRLSDTMEEGTVAQWLKKVGDTVKEGDILAEIETDKATMEFEAFHAGTLLHVGIQEGETAAVDSVLALIGPKGADVKAALAATETPKAVETSPQPAVASPTPPAPSPEKTKPLATNTPPPTSQPATNGRVMASPLAKKIAQEKGINLAAVDGTGEQGRIIKRDVENLSSTGATYTAPVGVERVTELANSQMRKTIAKRLAASKFSAPHYYLGVEYNMDNAIAFRAQYNTLPDTKISFNDIVIKAVAMALRQHPEVNAQWFDDKIVQHHHMHIGVAVAVTDGLVVPVVKFADSLSLPHIGSAVRDFAQRARDKKLTPAEMEGSTFTVSNLGMFGIQEFTSIINQPNAAILSVGSIEEKPVVKEGKIVVGHTMKLTLACDHRTVDGATGAQFLQTLRNYIENPVTLLV